ncbi:hypothetical protein FMEAI12_3740041 [Parafrankia sp. Ea1.12]|nr:hypothetical protein FMEAI12_3740041 [Parafrankia sp. Ea1.12]
MVDVARSAPPGVAHGPGRARGSARELPPIIQSERFLSDVRPGRTALVPPPTRGSGGRAGRAREAGGLAGCPRHMFTLTSTLNVGSEEPSSGGHTAAPPPGRAVGAPGRDGR